MGKVDVGVRRSGKEKLKRLITGFLIPIIENFKFLGYQNIVLRGHRVSGQFSSQSY